MSDSLEELKAQRAAIALHLAWLDTIIASAESDLKSPTDTVANDASLPVSPGLSAAKPIAAAPTTSPPLASDAVKSESTDPVPTKLGETPPELDEYEQTQSSEIHRAKFGCVALFIFGCLFFLFLLFGLPYLLQ